MAYGQKIRHDYDPYAMEEPRSSADWLSSLFPEPVEDRDAKMSSDDVKLALNSLRKMMNAQTRQTEEFQEKELNVHSPLMTSLAAMQGQMAQLVATLNQREVQAQTVPAHAMSVAARQKQDTQSLLRDIEARQAQIMGGQKKPQVQAQHQQAAPAYHANQTLMRQDLSSLGHALADVVPQKTVDALRAELRNLATRQQAPQDLSGIQNSLTFLARQLEEMAQKPQPETISLQQSNALLERKFEQLSRNLRDSIPVPQQVNTVELERKFEQLAHSLRETIPVQHSLDTSELERKFEQLAHSLRANAPAPQSSNSSELERVFSILLQKIEATDRKIDQLSQREVSQREISQRENVQREAVPIVTAPVYQQPSPVAPAPKAMERLQTRINPTQEPAPRQNSRPIETGAIAFDMPLEPGQGSPRGRVGMPPPQAAIDMPMARMTFETAIEETSLTPKEKSKAMQGLLAHKNKILLGIAAILLAFGGLKAIEMLKPTPAKKLSETQSQPFPTVKKIETAKIQQESLTKEPAVRDVKLFAPNGIDPIITGSPPPLNKPGVAMNNGWSPVISSEEKNTVKSLSESNNPSAQFEIANRMFDGKLLPKNEAGAIALYQKAADQNFAPAQFRLGSLYEKGIGVTKDRVKAQRLYLSAANLGHAKSMHNLAVLSADNSEGKGDLKVASQWFRKAAEHNVTDSQYNLAVLYARGLGVEQSMTESYKWFALAAIGGDVDAGNKRDDLAKRMSPENLSATKIAVESFVPRKEPESATRIDLPPELSNNAQGNLLTRQITGKKI